MRTGITIHGGFLPIERPVVFPHNESGLHPEVPPETPAVVEFKPESSNVQHSTSWSYSDKSPFVPIDEINSPEHVSSHNIGSPGVAAFSESVAETSVPNVPDEHQPIPPVTLTERTDDTKTTLSHTSVKDDTTPLDDSNFLTDGFVGKTNSFIAETATTHSRVSSIAAAFDTDTSKDGIENRITDHEFHPTPAVYYNSPTTNVNEEIGYELSNDHQSSLGSTIHTAFPSTTLKMSPIGSANFWPSLKVSSKLPTLQE